MPLAAGSRLGPYEVLVPIGAGGMGEVYRARDTRLSRSVALKVLPASLSVEKKRLQRFEKEARAASALNHPNIVTIYEVGTSDGVSYIAMELVEGRTLRELIHTGPLPLSRLLPLAAQFADGLGKAHEAGIVHRDLKPENVMVTKDGLVKILDFGLAKLTQAGEEAEAENELSTTPGATEPGTILGTVGYMSPEQASGRLLDFRSDQFSFGSILYEMATGKRAFERGTKVQTLAAIIDEEPEAIGKANEKLPVSFCWIVERCLAKEAEQRYSATRDLAHDLAMLRDHASEISTTSVKVSKPRRRRAWRWALSAIAGLGLAIGLATAIWRGEKPAKTAGPIRSLAVLPLQNLSRDAGQEYFADGMTDELVTELSRIGSLRIVSRTSMMQYKGTKKPVPQIAKELNVDAVVEGSVARSGDRVTIQAHLIEGATDRSLWGERYERDLQDIPAMQSEAARAIAKKIRVKLSPQEDERLASARPVNAEAYELYLRGRSALESLTTPGKETALRLFEQATALDPAFARAHAGIARVYLRGGAGVAPEKARTRAEQATERALSLDESLPEAHLAAASLRKAALDWVGTEREYRRAIELDPNSVEARVEYGVWLSALARHAEALEQVRLANSLDPLSPRAAWAAAWVLRVARRYDEAIAQAKKALALDPNYGPAHQILGLCYSARGKFDEAIAAFQRSGRRSGNIGQTYALAGRTREARKLLADFEAHYEQTGSGAMDIAQIYVGLGDNDRAFEWLARDRPPSEHFTFKVAEIWDPLRSDPRFARLLERWRLTDAQMRPPAPGQERR